MSSSVEQIKRDIKTYVGVLLALMVLTVVTVAVAQVHLVIPIAVTLALIIAIVKGSLVASFFMHLVHERQAIIGALILTVVFVLALIALPLLGHVDRVAFVR